MLPCASVNDLGREKIFATFSIEPLPDVRIMPKAAGERAVAIAAIGSSGVYDKFSIIFPQ